MQKIRDDRTRWCGKDVRGTPSYREKRIQRGLGNVVMAQNTNEGEHQSELKKGNRSLRKVSRRAHRFFLERGVPKEQLVRIFTKRTYSE